MRSILHIQLRLSDLNTREWCGCRALLEVAEDGEARRVAAAEEQRRELAGVSVTVTHVTFSICDARVVVEDHGLVRGEEALERLLIERVRVRAGHAEHEEVGNVDDADAQARRILLQSIGGVHNLGRDLDAGTGEHDVRVAALVGAEALPDRRAGWWSSASQMHTISRDARLSASRRECECA